MQQASETSAESSLGILKALLVVSVVIGLIWFPALIISMLHYVNTL